MAKESDTVYRGTTDEFLETHQTIANAKYKEIYQIFPRKEYDKLEENDHRTINKPL